MRHPQKIMRYKNDTPCEKIPKGYLPRAKLSDFLKRILRFVLRLRPMVMGFYNQVFRFCVKL